MYLTEFLTIAVAHLFAVASPGPDFAVVFRNAISRGRQAGIWTSLGISLGILLHVSYCVLGIGLLIASSPLLFSSVKLVAAAYLAYLGISSIRASLSMTQSYVASTDSSEISVRSLVFTGFLTNGLNPKATLFFLALYSVVVDAQTPLMVQAGYGLYLAIATFVWFALLSMLLGLASVRGFLLSAGPWFERIMGIILIALAVQLVVSITAI